LRQFYVAILAIISIKLFPPSAKQRANQEFIAAIVAVIRTARAYFAALENVPIAHKVACFVCIQPKSTHQQLYIVE